jgi:geranylgeranyl transferase type-2 subunit alpha
MHGIRKSDVPKTPEEEAATLDLVKKYKEVSSQVMALRKARQFDQDALKLSACVVALNPEFWIVWSFRRDIILHLISTNSSLKKDLGEAECALTKDALMKNPKSYSSWFQREWLLKQRMANVEKELRLCDALLNQDERNFHCWNYRRLVARHAQRTPEEELSFTMQKIEQNFSNYSAFQQRSLLLQQPLTLDCILNEVEMVKQAVFTEPDDQSNWFYYRWLIQSMLKLSQDVALESLITDQVQWIDELIEVEPKAKLALVIKNILADDRPLFLLPSFIRSHWPLC